MAGIETHPRRIATARITNTTAIAFKIDLVLLLIDLGFRTI
jgi:hypothetical protein